MRLPRSPGMCQAAMHVGIGMQQRVKQQRSDDRANEPPQRDILHPPK
jgi:hypothetical protein